MNKQRLFKNVETFPKGASKLTIADLKNYQAMAWYVRFRYFDESSNKWKLVIRKPSVDDKYLPLRERRDLLVALKEAVEFKLEHQSWNPITNTYVVAKSSDEMDYDALKEMPFSEALQFAYDKKKGDWSYKTGQDYRSMLKFITQACIMLSLDRRQIQDIKRVHCRLVLDKVKELRSLTNKGFNKYRETLSSFFSELEELEMVEYNPVRKIRSKEEVKVFAHRPPTSEQRQIIFEKIKKDHRNYYRFLSVLYGCTIRPKEITRLKVKHLIRDEQIFRIVPDRLEGNLKTMVQREVIIPNWVMKLLDEMNLLYYKPDDYIFSGKPVATLFTPGANRMHQNTPTNWWNKIVIKGLKINVSQYSLKKLSGNDMVKLQRNQGVGNLLAMPQLQMGHASSAMTEVYVDEHKKIINDIIKKAMPVL